MMVSQGAEVTIDKTVKDGLQEVQKDFSNAERTSKGIVLTFDSDVLFPLNSSYLTDQAKTEVAKLVKLMSKYPQASLLIEGHTDATGEASYNQWLSEKRAASVKAHAVQLGFSADKITTKGYGKDKPVTTNSTADGRQKNRRVEITILESK